MVKAHREPELDREKAAKLAELVTALARLEGDALDEFQETCEATLPARSAAASVLSDGLSTADGWTLPTVSRRLPSAMRALNEVTRGDTLAHLSTEQRAALTDAMVAVIWREYADTLGSRLVATLTSPFHTLGLSA
ncbi:MAG: hypothetical protein DI630_13480 [Gordonia sp. (in: high G+C Gram-positive bacteria)]|nr:MAG: hypothetical protein DI630_13480 [Gordonia sp. (in: high G+C Gram-positive bacteria)]